MDLILDTNIYVSLLYTNGSALFESAPFLSLLAYLRRTGDSLVIPDVVYQEFRHEYQERIQLSFKKAQDAWDSHVRDLASPQHFPKTLNVQKEWEKIEADFLKPDKRVNVIHYQDYSKVPTQEIVKRGVNRIPPASAKGEELRDVIIWFMTLEYARGKKVAFICSDGHFHSGNTLHPDLQKDLDLYGADINFSKTIADFIKGNSLTTSQESLQTFHELTAGYDIQSSITEYLLNKSLEGRTITGAVVRDIALHEGTRYEVSSDSAYVELTVKGAADLQLTTPAYVSLYNFTPTQPKQPWTFDPGAFYGEMTPAFAGLAGLPAKFSGINIFDQPVTLPSKTLTTETQFLAYYQIRIVSNQRKSIEIDHVFITKMSEFREIRTPASESTSGPS